MSPPPSTPLLPPVLFEGSGHVRSGTFWYSVTMVTAAAQGQASIWSVAAETLLLFCPIQGSSHSARGWGSPVFQDHRAAVSLCSSVISHVPQGVRHKLPTDTLGRIVRTRFLKSWRVGELPSCLGLVDEGGVSALRSTLKLEARPKPLIKEPHRGKAQEALGLDSGRPTINSRLSELASGVDAAVFPPLYPSSVNGASISFW